jgi:hypothetical protein
VLSLEDLTAAKKTQQSKDWPMIQRLAERVFFTSVNSPEHAVFLMRELRTPELLTEMTRKNPELATQIAGQRPAVRAAMVDDRAAVEAALEAEESAERAKDRAYWEPLRRELEQMRREARESG